MNGRCAPGRSQRHHLVPPLRLPVDVALRIAFPGSTGSIGGMRTPLLLAAIGLLLFVAPLRSRAAPAAKRNLYGLTRDLLRVTGAGTRKPGLAALGGLACGSVFLPALWLALVQLAPAAATRWLLGAGAVLLTVATAAVWLLTTLSRSTFGFGPGTSERPSLAARSMPLFLLGAAAMATLGAATAGWAQWLRDV